MTESSSHNLGEVLRDGEPIYQLAKRLFPICRSITGDGVRRTLEIIKEDIPELQTHEVPSGTKCFDWTVPKEWNISDGYLIYKNKKIIDFKKHSLHVMNYSAPINKTLGYNNLTNHLFTLPKIPNAIPYVHSYYNRNWGFALSHDQFKKLNKKGKYKAVIKSSLKPGHLYYSNNLIEYLRYR